MKCRVHASSVSFVLVLLFTIGFSLAVTTGDALAQTRPALVKDVENPAHAPFIGFASSTFTFNFLNTILNMGTVPSGKRLVIEHVGVSCTGDTDESFPSVTISVYKAVPLGWTSWGIPVQMSLQGTTWDGKATWTASQNLRLYSDGVNAPTNININHKKTATTPSCYATVSGYTVDVP